MILLQTPSSDIIDLIREVGGEKERDGRRVTVAGSLAILAHRS